MYSLASFPASAVDPDELNAITADCLALERLRIFRRLLVKRFGLLAVISAAVSLAWLSRFALWFGVSVCVAPPAFAWAIDIRRQRRLAARLNGVPGLRTSPLTLRMRGSPERNLRKS